MRTLVRFVKEDAASATVEYMGLVAVVAVLVSVLSDAVKNVLGGAATSIIGNSV